MKNRTPTKPNRYAIYDEAHNFLRYEYHERADDPTDPGTPINKQTLLQDATAASLGLPDTATPNEAFAVLGAKAPPKLLAAYKTAGAYTWTVPAGVTKVLVAMIGGGGGGSYPDRYQSHDAGSPGSGSANIFEATVTTGAGYPIVVGAGGLAGAYARARGTDGGTSSALGNTADGGVSPDWFGEQSKQGGGAGGQGGFGSSEYEYGLIYGGVFQQSYVSINPISCTAPSKSPNVYVTMLKYGILPFCCSVSSYKANESPIPRLPNGNMSTINGTSSLYPPTIGNDPGGGGAVGSYWQSETDNHTFPPTNGVDGAVFIYNYTGR